MNIIRERTSIPIPHIFEFKTSIDRLFRYLYILIEYLGGHKLNWLMKANYIVLRQLKNV